MQMNRNIYLKNTPIQFLSGHIKILGMVHGSGSGVAGGRGDVD